MSEQQGSDVACLQCARIAAGDDKVHIDEVLFSITTCGLCGRTWTFERGAWVKGDVMPKCLACGHFMCPCCKDWCDTLVPAKEDPEDYALCCDGRCTFAELPQLPEAVAAAPASGKVIAFVK